MIILCTVIEISKRKYRPKVGPKLCTQPGGPDYRGIILHSYRSVVRLSVRTKKDFVFDVQVTVHRDKFL